MVEDLEGVKVIMDDVVVVGDETTHDERLQKFLDRASKQGLKLNKEKCKIRQTQVPYVGHLLTSEGLKIDPQKVMAVQEMPVLQSKEDVKRLLGFVQFLSRYLPSLSTVDTPLRELEKEDMLRSKRALRRSRSLYPKHQCCNIMMSRNQQGFRVMQAGKAWEQCYCRTTNPCVTPLERLPARSQGTHPLKLKCWQSSSPAASSTNTSMANMLL